MALLTPLLLTLLIGIIELGRYAYLSILVGNAARAGAAYGAQSLAQSSDTAGIHTAADNDLKSNGQNSSNLIVTSCTACGCDSGGTVAVGSCGSPGSGCAGAGAGICAAGHWVVTVSVTASDTFNSLFTYLRFLNSFTVSNTCTLRVTQ